MAHSHPRSLFDRALVRAGLVDAVGKLDPRVMWRTPVMFVVEIGAVLTTVQLLRDVAAGASGLGFEAQIVVWLWLTVLFANFAEAMAEGRGKAQAASLRRAKADTMARRRTADGGDEQVPARQLRR